jgi:hypothetical protein
VTVHVRPGQPRGIVMFFCSCLVASGKESSSETDWLRGDYVMEILEKCPPALKGFIVY